MSFLSGAVRGLLPPKGAAWWFRREIMSAGECAVGE